MKKKKVQEQTPIKLNMNMLFVVTVFAILLGVVGLIIGTVYIFKGMGLLQFEAVEIPGWLFMMILAVASLTLGTLMSYLMSKFVLKASNSVVKGLNKLASGDFKARLDLGESEAHVQLSNAFNKLAHELEDTKMLRSDFINEFAHEFKTPIVSIKGFAQLLTEKELSEAQKNEYINIIIEEASRLSSLARNYLDLTKVEKQNILTDTSEFNLSEQIRSSLLLLETKWTEKNLFPEMSGKEVSVVANEEMLKQVWINLIDNAIKFAHPQGCLGVDVELDKTCAVVRVTNSGVTIEEQEKTKIFEKFYRSKTSNGAEGSGVGLAIVKKIVDLHNGNVSVVSENGITTFIIVIPKAKEI